MDYFLKETAKYLFDHYGERMDSCALVFPNRRSSLFFSRHLSKLIEKPVWAPRMYTVSELMQELSGMEAADPILLNFLLYRVYRKVTGSTEGYDRFYNWGEVIMADFDEMDKYMADPSALFSNVAELKEVEDIFSFLTPEQQDIIKRFWKNFDGEKRSREQREFLNIWASLPEIYERFRESLNERGLASEGMICRKVASDISSGNLSLPHSERFFITGFNALNPCEKSLFRFLREKNRASFFWDYDDYYTSPVNHQAGIYMRENLKEFPQEEFGHDPRRIEKGNPEITVLAASGNIAQAKLAGSLSDLPGKDDLLSAAVVLPDENLLPPLLSSLPPEVNEVNVTMGYPLRDTPQFGFVMNLLSLVKSCRTSQTAAANSGTAQSGTNQSVTTQSVTTQSDTTQSGTTNSGTANSATTEYYYSDVLSLLNNPLFRKHCGEEAAGLTGMIKSGNMVYISREHLVSPGLPELVFTVKEGGMEYLDHLLEILVFLYEGENEEEDDREDKGEDKVEEEAGVKEYVTSKPAIPGNEIISRLYAGVNRLREVLGEAETDIDFETLAKLLKKILYGIRIPFYGEPLAGLQVMGVLETRALDFKKVIWLSMNEGIFPAKSHNASFIPQNIRKAFGLPVNSDYDAVYAYYFYRMLQRSESVTLIYNASASGLFTGEMSRFIYQLKHSGNFSVTEKEVSSRVLPVAPLPVKIPKCDDVFRRLLAFTGESGENRILSPSAVNSYIDCPLRFYFRYIVRLSEPEEVTGEVDMAAFGSLLHEAACSLYRPFKGKRVEAGQLEELKKERGLLNELVFDAFEKVFFRSGERGKKPEGNSMNYGQRNHTPREKSESSAGRGHTPDDRWQTAAGRRHTPEGRNLIIAEVLVSYLQQLLERDKGFAPLEIVALEEFFNRQLGVDVNGQKLNVRIGGIIDRIDLSGYTLRIADYKTGGDETDFRGMDSLFKAGNTKRNGAAFQVFLYSWICMNSGLPGKRISPMLYLVKKLFEEGQFTLTDKGDKGRKVDVTDFGSYGLEFEERLKGVVSEIFDRDIPFEQAEDADICRYCPYTAICHRP